MHDSAPPRSPRWLHNRSDRAWAELLFLGYSPLWIAAVAVVLLSGAIDHWADRGLMAFSLAVGLPPVLAPLAFKTRPDAGRPLRTAYWLKFNLWVFIVVVFGTFIGTHYFFDLMGMHYAFNVQWTLQAEVVGRSGQHVPLFMYPLTHGFFITYHVVMLVVFRWVQARWHLGRWGRAAAVVVIAYVLAFSETFVMANEALSEYFRYADKARMLWLGSIGYAAYYVVTLPMLARMDDDPEAWPMWRVAVDALGACMLILFMLEAWALIVGPL